MIGLSEVNITEQQNNVQGHSVKRQGSEHKSRPNHVGNNPKRRSKSAERLPSSTSSLSSSVATAEANNQPPCTVGEKVMVDTPRGFKFGKVKFIGSTEFAAGEWIGVALERPNGKFVVCLYYHMCIYYLIRKT